MAAIQSFDEWLATQPELKAKYDSAKTKHTGAVETPKVMYLAPRSHRRAREVQRLRVPEDKDGELHVWQPLDTLTYSSDTLDNALAKMGREMTIGKGTLSYADSSSSAPRVDAPVKDPPDNMIFDALATGGDGGGLRRLRPRPT